MRNIVGFKFDVTWTPPPPQSLHIIAQKVNRMSNIDMSVYNPLSERMLFDMCKVCGHPFATPQSLAAHVDSEHPEAEQPETF